MRTADFISDAATLSSDDARQTPELTRYALEGFAIEVDAKIQSELLTKLILSHSEIARRLETAVETLRRSEAALKEAQQIALLGRWDIDLATGRRVWSESLYSILELDPSTEPTAELFLSRLHPDQREEALRIYAALSERKEPWTIHYRLLMPDEREKVIQLLVHTEYAEGKAVRSYGTL